MWVEFIKFMTVVMPLMTFVMMVLVIAACCKYLYGDKEKHKKREIKREIPSVLPADASEEPGPCPESGGAGGGEL